MRKTAAQQHRVALRIFQNMIKLLTYHNESHIEKTCNRTLFYGNTKEAHLL